MKNIYKHILLVFTFLVIVSSCGEDWLELELTGALPFASESIDTEDKAFEVLCSAYDFLQVKYYTVWSSYYMIGNLPSGDAVPVGGGTSDRPEYWDIYNFAATPENPALLQFWRRNYFGIYRANIIINDIAIESAEMDQFRAEAKFLRAYFYFELVRAFGNVAFYTENLSPSEYKPTNTDKGVIYEQILLDLQEAIPLLPNKSEQSSFDLTRVSKGAAQAFLGKVLLYVNNFDEAAQVLGTVVNSGEYDLYPEYDSLFNISQEFGIESVFEIPYMSYSHHGDEEFFENGREAEGNIDAQLNGPRETAFPGYYLGAWGFDMIDSSLIDAWDAAGDAVRKYGTGFGPEFFKENLELDPDKDLNDNGFPDDKEKEGWTGWYQKKRTSKIGTNLPGEVWTFDVNERIIRFSDVLLMHAEALVRKSSPDNTTAIAQVNRVRSRVGLPALSGLSGDALFAAIKLERRLELAMEGHRFYDLVRWGDASTVLGSQGFVAGKHEVFPIPESEIGVTNLVQNNGY
jgi:hypothetical protein